MESQFTAITTAVLIKECNKAIVLPTKEYLPLDKPKHFLKTVLGAKSRMVTGPTLSHVVCGKTRAVWQGCSQPNFPPSWETVGKQTKPGGM